MQKSDLNQTSVKKLFFSGLNRLAKVYTKLTLASSIDKLPDFQDERTFCADEILEPILGSSKKLPDAEKHFHFHLPANDRAMMKEVKSKI